MQLLTCKHCQSSSYIKRGKIRGKQSYSCNSCHRTFVQGDLRQRSTPESRALAVLLYGSGKASLRFIAKLLNVSAPTVIYWLSKLDKQLPEPKVDQVLKEVEFDEMWHFINKKNNKYGYGEQWTVLPVKPLHGLLGIVLLKASKSSSQSSPV